MNAAIEILENTLKNAQEIKSSFNKRIKENDNPNWYLDKLIGIDREIAEIKEALNKLRRD